MAVDLNKFKSIAHLKIISKIEPVYTSVSEQRHSCKHLVGSAAQQAL